LAGELTIADESARGHRDGERGSKPRGGGSISRNQAS
jgi:hypothetical protein